MKLLHVLGTLLVLSFSGGLSYYFVSQRPEPERVERPVFAPAVSVVEVSPERVELTVHSQGTVRPRTETTLMAEVAGRVTAVAPQFRPGGFFEEGEWMATIDQADYRAALADAEANLAQAELTLALERAQAEQAAADWEDLGRGEPTALALRQPQIRQAEAAVASAKARVDKASRDLERTQLRAPYDASVLETFIERGGYLSGGGTSRVARIFATDTVEIRLPLTDQELALLEIPFTLPGSRQSTGPKVTLEAAWGTTTHQWKGHITRTEAEMDDRSRLTFVVAEVDQPLTGDPTGPPLRPGMFVQATIEGQVIEPAYVLPRRALRPGNQLYILTPDNTLETRQVTPVQTTATSAILSQGLEPGDRVITTPLENRVEGMALTLQVP